MKSSPRARGPTLASSVFLLFFSLASLQACRPAEAPHAAHATGELALQSRLLAPCCWNQTLDTHESDVATALKDEIRRRLSQGEASERIEDDFASRYGERIRAVPKGKDPRNTVPILIAVAMGVAALGLLWLLPRWARKPAAVEEKTPPTASVKEYYDALVDEELRGLDER